MPRVNRLTNVQQTMRDDPWGAQGVHDVRFCGFLSGVARRVLGSSEHVKNIVCLRSPAAPGTTVQLSGRSLVDHCMRRFSTVVPRVLRSMRSSQLPVGGEPRRLSNDRF